MSQAFIKAAASYYGISPDNIHEDSDITTRIDGNLFFVFYVKPSDADLIGIGKRMEQMKAPAKKTGVQFDRTTPKEFISPDAFQQPKNESGPAMMIGARDVSHITTDQPEQEADPTLAGVWLTAEEVTADQMIYASDVDPARGFLVNAQVLTPEQRAARGIA